LLQGWVSSGKKPVSAEHELEVSTGLNRLKVVKAKMLVSWDGVKNCYSLQQLFIRGPIFEKS